MVPASPHWQRLADKEYVVGQSYALEEIQERSPASHRAYFAAVNEAWANLPEHLAEEFPTADHLRRHALIRTGYADKQTVACATLAEALRWAAVVRSIDTYAIVEVSGTVVTRWTAQSQSYRSMKREVFQASKEAVLDYLAELIGVTGDELAQQGQAA
jgi:hypothetical protein